MKKENYIFIGITVVLIVGLLLAAFFLSGNDKILYGNDDVKNIDYNVSGNEVSMPQYKTENPVVALYIQNYGSIVMELYPDVAPNTVNNFISLIKDGYYDGNTFHRLMEGFVLQGGDRTGTGTGGPGYKIKGEFTNNGFENNLKHERGVVSMARGSYSMDSAGGQFFIVLGEDAALEGNYASFGRVIDGMDLIEAIEKNEKVADKDSGKLETNLVIVKTVVDLKGKTYPPVEKMS